MIAVRRTIVALLALGAATFVWWPALPPPLSAGPAASPVPSVPAVRVEAPGIMASATNATTPMSLAAAADLVQRQCRHGWNLEIIRAFPPALEAYTRLLEVRLPAGVDLECARRGRLRVSYEQERALAVAREGEALAVQGRFMTAEDRYRIALGLDPANAVARQGLQALQAELAPARRSVSLGRYWKARAELAAAVSARPPAELPPDLQFLASVDTIALRYVEDVRNRDLAIALCLAIVLMLVLLAVRRGTLQIDAFTGADGAIADGKELVALVGQELQALAQVRPGNLHLVRAPLAEIAVPAEITKLAPSWGSVADGVVAALKWLIPRRTTIVSGMAQERSDAGTMVTLTLSRGHRIKASGTVSEADFTPVSAGPRTGATRRVLAQAIATWIVFALKKNRRLLGTTNWKSYALFRASMETSDVMARRDLLTQALVLDVNNRGARMSLGAWLVERGENEAAARELRATILRSMRDERAGFLVTDTVWYSALYRWTETLSAAGRVHAAYRVAATLVESMEAMRVDGGARWRWWARLCRLLRGGHLWLHLRPTAWRRRADVVTAAVPGRCGCSGWKALRHQWWRLPVFWWRCRRDERLQAFLEMVLPVGRAMLAGVAAAAGRRDEAEYQRLHFDDADFSRTFAYNRACSDALTAEARRKAADPSADRFARDAFASLRTALVLGFDDAWAAQDPTLAELARTRADGFAALTGSGDLAPIKALERPTIRALVREGVDTVAALADRASGADAAGLARRLGVPRRQLEAWAAAARLSRWWTFEKDALAALTECGVHSLDDLRAADAARLTAALGTAYARLYPLRTPPSVVDATRWIERARAGDEPAAGATIAAGG